jgi:hypothetical protein
MQESGQKGRSSAMPASYCFYEVQSGTERLGVLRAGSSAASATPLCGGN